MAKAQADLVKNLVELCVSKRVARLTVEGIEIVMDPSAFQPKPVAKPEQPDAQREKSIRVQDDRVLFHSSS